MANGFPVSLDDLKTWFNGVSDPNHWQRALDQLSQAKNNVSNYQNRITPSGGSPISGPPMSMADVWQRLKAATSLPGQGATQPVNQSGQR